MIPIVSRIPFALCIVAALFAPHGASADALVLETSWGTTGTLPGQFKYPVALDVSSDGSIYVLDRENSRIQQFTQEGVFLNVFGKSAVIGTDGELHIPLSLATSPLGWVYVGDINRIHRYTTAGALTHTYNRPGNLGETRGLTCDADGSVLVTDTMTGRLLRLAEDGAYEAEVDLTEFVPGPVGPYDVATHASGAIYVLDIWGVRVIVLDEDFSFLRTWSAHVVPGFAEPQSIAVAGDDVFVTDINWFLRFDTSGTPTGEWGTPGDPAGPLPGALGVAGQADGRVFVTTGGNQVLRYGPAPVQTTATTWGHLKGLHR